LLLFVVVAAAVQAPRYLLFGHHLHSIIMGQTPSKPDEPVSSSSSSSSAPPPSAVSSPSRPRVGNYEVLQKIGSGTEATVFTVRDMRDGSTKVLKALNPGRSRGRNSPSFVHGVCIERE
jgi:hypothetical protein